MITARARIQLLIFAAVTVMSVAYGGVRYLGLSDLTSDPYPISAQFEFAGGAYPRADVELLGTKVGRVSGLRPGRGGTTLVEMLIDEHVELPAALTVRISNKSAIGEQVVELTPQASAGPQLRPGTVIPVSQTTSPVRTEDLLGHVDDLLGSLPVDDLRTALDELSVGLAGSGPDLATFITNAEAVSSSTEEHAASLTELIRNSQTVLGTQVDIGSDTQRSLARTADLLSRLEGLNHEVGSLLDNGTDATREVSALLTDIREPLPGLLENLELLTAVLDGDMPALRKTLVLFPWAVELGALAIRYCDKYDPKTGKPIQETCHYDSMGRPDYHAYFAAQAPETPGKAPYLPCTRGYEGTRRFQPDGTAVGGGPRQSDDEPPNMNARCTSPPTDPIEPNVRGPQNVR